MNVGHWVRCVWVWAAALGVSVGAQGCITINALGGLGDRGRVSPEVIEPAKSFLTLNEIVMIPITGVISIGDESALLGEPGTLVGVKDRLRAAEENRRLRALVLRIDSPGGGVTASDLIYREIVEFKKKKNVPVIALMSGTAASGGLYVAMAADEIYALPTTLTGSIGVIAIFPQLTGLSDKIGLAMNIVKSGAHKDAGSPWRAMNDADRAIFQRMIDEYYARFLDIVLESRQAKGLTRDGLRAIADGRVLTPEAALEAHLIDGIRYMDDVLARARELAGIRDARLISYEYPYRYRGHYYAITDAMGAALGAGRTGGDLNLFKLDLGSLLAPPGGAHFYYLWLP